jgi:hypothetical protein
LMKRLVETWSSTRYQLKCFVLSRIRDCNIAGKHCLLVFRKSLGGRCSSNLDQIRPLFEGGVFAGRTARIHKVDVTRGPVVLARAQTIFFVWWVLPWSLARMMNK